MFVKFNLLPLYGRCVGEKQKWLLGRFYRSPGKWCWLLWWVSGACGDWEKWVTLRYCLNIKLVEFNDGLDMGEREVKVKDGWRATVAHVYNPRTLGGWGGRITGAQEFKTSLCNTVRLHLYKKCKNLPGVWWCVFVVPVTREFEVGRSLEARSLRLQWARITSLHCNLGDRAKPCL